MSEHSNASLKIHMQEKRKQEDVAEIMKNLVNETNVMGMEKAVAAGIVQGLMGSHRTLQQSFMRAFMLACKEIDEKGYSSDLRNEQSMKVIKKIAKMDEYLPFV